MPSARDAKEWAAAGGLHGIGDSLYTPVQRYATVTTSTTTPTASWCATASAISATPCSGSPAGSPSGGRSPWTSASSSSRSRSRRRAAIAPATVIQACTSAAAAKDCVELTQHAQAAGADICYLQTPPMEVHGGEGVLRFFQYVADRTDIALGMFNSPSSGLRAHSRRGRADRQRGPGGVRHQGRHARVLAQQGGPRVGARVGHLGVRHHRVPSRMVAAGHRRVPRSSGRPGTCTRRPTGRSSPSTGTLMWDGRIAEAMDHARDDRARPDHRGGRATGTSVTRADPTTSATGASRSGTRRRSWACRWVTTRTPGRRRRILPDEGKAQIRALYESIGFAKQLATA